MGTFRDDDDAREVIDERIVVVTRRARVTATQGDVRARMMGPRVTSALDGSSGT